MKILIGSEKGGAGKTTIAINVATALALSGRDVLLVDTDEQMSARKWSERRERLAPERVQIPCVERRGNVISAIQDLEKRYVDLVVDAGGRNSKELRSALAAVDLVMIPLRPSQLDLDTVETMYEMLDAARVFNPELEARFLFTQVPTHRLVTEGSDAREALSDVTGIELASSRVFERKIYRDAAAEGLSVVEKTGRGRAEIDVLVQEIRDTLGVDDGGDNIHHTHTTHTTHTPTTYTRYTSKRMR
ncbi:MAG TPA: division plane positioning ATPase MipZ [Thiohalobacter sp.]|nr:division plane positioning ATPase MipZ [Thiohalobacter sp.]